MKKALVLLLLMGSLAYSQHHSKMVVTIDNGQKVVSIQQELTFFNQTNDTLSQIALNDWVNGYSSKNTALSARFSDEFERSFLLAKEKDRGRTSNLSVLDAANASLTWSRNAKTTDIIEIQLKEKLLPNQKVTLSLSYTVKIPNDKFTRYGYDENGRMYLKDFFLTPARYENHDFVKYDNLNLDDIANAVTDYDVEVKVPQGFDIYSDLDEKSNTVDNNLHNYHFEGNNRLGFNLFLDNKKDFEFYKNGNFEIVSSLKDKKLNDIQRALLVDKVVSYVNEHLGKYPHNRITIAQADYDKNPFYGLNQLPLVISPFPDEFLYEIKFLKTYLNNYLHTTLQLNQRTDYWVYDAIQV